MRCRERIRVQRDLREQFLAVCHAQDRPAAQILREFMREYVARYASEVQQDIADEAIRGQKPSKPSGKV